MSKSRAECQEVPAKGTEPDLPRDKKLWQMANKCIVKINPLKDIIPKPVPIIVRDVIRGKDLSELITYAEDALISALEDGDELRILVTGKTGQGKSTLINGLLGAEVAREGAGAARCTTEVEVFKKKIYGVPVVVFDSPGLQDNTSNERKYIKNMKKTCQNLSLALYCTKMTNTRLGDDDKKAMKKLTEAFGPEFWNHAVFVLTFANMELVERWDERDKDDPSEEPHSSDKKAWESLKKRRFEGRIQIWEEELHKFLTKEVKVNSSIAHGIPVIPTGDHKPTISNPTPLRLPDRDNWFQELWETCSFRVKEHGLFLKINCHRMNAVDDGDDRSTCQIDDLPRETEKKAETEIEKVQKVPIVNGDMQVSPLLMPPVEKKGDSKCKASREKESLNVKEHKETDELSSMSPVHETKARLKTVTTVTSHSRPPPKLQVKSRPRSASIPIIMSTYERNELERFIPNSIPSREVHPGIQSESDYIQVCEGPNENTPCEDTLDEDIYPNENETTHDAESKRLEGLQSESIRITTNYTTKMGVELIEKRFGHGIAEAFKAALKLIAKPSQWFIKLITRRKTAN